MEPILSDKVVKHEFAGDYQALTVPIATSGLDFKPFLPVISATKVESKVDFYPDKLAVVRQAQVKNEDWQAFSMPRDADVVGVAAKESDMDEGHMDEGHMDEGDMDEGDIGQGGTDEVMASSEVSPSQTEPYDAGYQQGYDQGFALGQSEGEVHGIEAGQQHAQALDEQRNYDIQKAVGYLNQVADTLADELLQPMQTLAVHLAKELVRGELSLSLSAIERLIMLSMKQLKTTSSVVEVQVSVVDFDRLQLHNGLPDQVVLKPSHDISLGSIKVEQAGSWVEDLMEDRLAQISQQVFGFVDDHFTDPMQMIELEQNLAPELKDLRGPVALPPNDQELAPTPEQHKRAPEDD